MSDKKLINIYPTCLYGTSDEENSKRYDMVDILKENLLDYRLTKIKCFLKSNSNSIYGIQITCKNRNDGTEINVIDVNSNGQDLIEQEFILPYSSEINNMNVWLDKDCKSIGFEVITRKKIFKKFGYGNDEELIKVPDFEKLDQVIVGFGCCADETNGVIGIYAYYMNRKIYISNIYDGIFSLRNKIKDPKFKGKTEQNLKMMSEKNRLLFRICQLPDNLFFSVIKYSIE